MKSKKTKTKITCVKGFNKDLTCRGFQYKIGKKYRTSKKVKLCEQGFHAISRNPVEVFEYYPPSNSRFAIVEQSGKIAKPLSPRSRVCPMEDDSKVASSEINIVREISLLDIADMFGASASPYSLRSKNKNKYGNIFEGTEIDGIVKTQKSKAAIIAHSHDSVAAGTGRNNFAICAEWDSAAITTKDKSASLVKSPRSVALTLGSSSTAVTEAIESVAVSMGDDSTAEANSPDCVAIAFGKNGAAKGEKGAILILFYHGVCGEIIHAWMGKVGKKGILPNTYYVLDHHGKPKKLS